VSDSGGTIEREDIPVFAFFAHSRYMPCPDCGASLAGEERAEHTCDRERRLDYQMFQLRDEIGHFDGELAVYLDSPAGRFEVWYAENRRAA
jgi:hypothetical protein